MRPEDRYDSLIRFYAERKGVPWKLVKAQVEAESSFEPRAVSSAGARGLLQLMPATAGELGVADPFCPEQCIEGGVRYLRRQYEAFPEVPEGVGRWKFALAAYHCGRGYVRRALERALAGGLSGQPRWATVREFLAEAEVRGKRPDAEATLRYVDRVVARWGALDPPSAGGVAAHSFEAPTAKRGPEGEEVQQRALGRGSERKGEGLWKTFLRALARWFSGSWPRTRW
ncbi:MAG: transglycosylase SLT domain-containing protein [Dehalococcoidia bacterium]